MANRTTTRKIALWLTTALFLLCAATAFLFPVPAAARTAHAAESGADHTGHGGDWTALSAEGGELTGGNYYLADDVKLTADLTVSGTVTLCLNGFVLTGTGSSTVIDVGTGADFTLCDCREGAAGVANEINGDTYNSGVITGGTGRRADTTAGGGIRAGYDSVFTMNGGAVAGNSADLGGGVYICGDAFIMNGGMIAGNTATGDIFNTGGGACVWDCAFTMNGGSIAGNTAAAEAGGVYMVGDTFTMNGGTIADNTAPNGSVVLSHSIFTINGGYLGADSIVGGEVSVTGGYFAADPEDTGYIPANAVADSCQVIRCAPEGSAYPYAVIEASSAHTHAQDGVITNFETVLDTAGGALAAGNYYLACDVTLSADLNVSGGVTLCLNGHVLTGTGTGSVVTVGSDADFTLCDCREGGEGVVNEINGADYNGGVITGGGAQFGGGVYVDGGTFAMSGGSIAGNTAFSGGGVYVVGGRFTMSGGSVADNDASESDGTTGHGGGVYVGLGDDGISAFEMSGSAEIAGNRATRRGAGVYVAEGSTFLMKGGAITDNIISGYYVPGGGVCVWDGAFTMEGGSVSRNEATHGGGVCVRNGTFNLDGGRIEDNASTVGGGVFLDANVYEGGAVTLRMRGGTIVNNRADDSYGGGIYVGDGVGFCMEGGYLGANPIEGEMTSVFISGGYFADDPAAYAAAGAVDGAKYTIVALSDDNHYGDDDYDGGYPYAVYGSGDVSGYAVADVETIYGRAYTPVVSGTAGDVDISYSYASDGIVRQGLPSAAGTYTVTAAFAVYIDGANKTRYPQGTAAFTVEIARAVYDMSTVSFDDATYTYDGTERTLVISGELPEGVTVTYSANTLTDAGEIEVTAAFVGDRANYDDIGPMTATLTIEKATPVYEVPENLTAVAGQTLADIALPEGWAWEDAALSVGETGENTFTAIYTPADTANYNAVSAELTLAVDPVLSGGEIAAIVIGCTLGALLIAYGVLALLFKKGVLKGAFFARIYPFIK